MQWETCLACCYLYFEYLVPENVRCLFSLSLSQLAWMPGHSDTWMHHFYVAHVHHACMCMMHMPKKRSHGLYMMQEFTFHSCHVGMWWHDIISVHIA